jgi:hypothetical protein
MKRAWSLCLAGVLSAAVVVGVTAATAATGKPIDVGTKHASVDVEKGQLPLAAPRLASTSGFGTLGLTASRAASAQVGDQKIFLILNDVAGQYQFTTFTLRGVGNHIEIWVQNNLSFPTGDCRNDGVRNVVTQAQVDNFVKEFDTNIYPKESQAFSVPPDRDGSDAQLPALLGQPNALGITPDYYEGSGEKIVTLVSNVRDSNYFTPPNVTPSSYIAGFFSTQLNAYFGRNVMTIDSFDWVHRTGANPPDEPVPGDLCKSAAARPHLYEGVFAHEYQHLLESYEDSDEFNWINEGLSDWAQTLVGYVKPSVPITDKGFDSHIQCFLGWLSVQTPANPNPGAGGPENSLTRWGDQGDGEILCDYGAVYSMMEFLQGRYGNDFMSNLHRGDANGFAGLQEALDSNDTRSGKGRHQRGKTKAADVLHDWSLMAALDGLVDDGARINGSTREKNVSAPTLDATINWDAPDAYSSPGAPSNGADYVRLRDASGNYLTGDRIDALSFQGQSTLPTRPVAWTVDTAAPLNPKGPALYSGAADNRDEAIVKEVSVPAGTAATLTFDALWNEEEDWDFGFAQISTDGGVTYESVACTNTTTQINPDALPTAQDNIPGFSGFSGGWLSQTCSLAPYAGKKVLLAFRAFNDPAFTGWDPSVPAGFWVDNVKVGTTLVSDGSSLVGWKSFSETKPTTVAGYTVYIVSMNSANLDAKKRKNRRDTITVKRLKLTSGFTIRGSSKVRKYVDKDADFVGAIVMYDDPTESTDDYARYALVVNGVVQPGGQ